MFHATASEIISLPQCTSTGQSIPWPVQMGTWLIKNVSVFTPIALKRGRRTPSLVLRHKWTLTFHVQSVAADPDAEFEVAGALN